MLKSLITSVTRKLSWHPERCLTFASLIYGLINQGSVQHHRLSQGFHHQSTYKAQLERIRRFFRHQSINTVKLTHNHTFRCD